MMPLELAPRVDLHLMQAELIAAIMECAWAC
jgi:hypothetical protein